MMPNTMSGSGLMAAVRIAVGCAMLAAAGQVGRNLFLQHVRGTFAWASKDAIWMAPLAFLAIFAALTVVLLSAGLAIGALRRPAVLAGVAGAVAAFSLVGHFGSLHPLASLLLAAGIGMRVAAGVDRNPRPWLSGLGLTGAVLAAVFVVAGAGERLWQWTRERTLQANVPVPAADEPNVLLIILDTMRHSNMSLYGYQRLTTPNISRYAAEGTVFEWAIAPSSWTLPTHAAMFTGRRAGELGVGWREPLRSSVPTLAEVLQQRGYATGGFVANLYYTTWESGLARGFTRYRDYRVSVQQILLSANLMQVPLVFRLLSARSADAVVDAVREFDLGTDLRVPSQPESHPRRSHVVAREFLEWERERNGRPFFAFINLFAAHDPYRVPSGWRRRFSRNPKTRDLYDAAIAMDDAVVGMVLDSLRARGVLDRTLVVISSDHGEHLGRRGLTSHGNSLYLSLLRVPLVLRMPGHIPPRERVPDPVTTTDLPGTVMSLLGVADHPFPKRSWFAAPDTAPMAAVLSELGKSADVNSPAGRGPMFSLVTARHHYIYSTAGDEELYDVVTDARELQNLADDERYRPVILEMRRVLGRRVPELAEQLGAREP